ncbi:Cys-tRNA(Pro) deacylase [Litoricolaceae bacterium]|nr:Cys-tRNA(Pro) deacylase [Litorivicinaceae bacterium]
MTPAIDAAKSAGIDFQIREYQHSPNADSYGLEAVQKLRLHPEQVFKTLVVSDYNSLFVGIIPVSNQLNLKLMAQVLGVKKVRMAEKRRVEIVTGYLVGGVSPIGQKKRLPTIIDTTAQGFKTIHVSAGKRGLEMELSASSLQRLTDATFALIAT